MSQLLVDLPGFTQSHLAALKRARLVTVSDILFLSLHDLANRCRIPPQDAQFIVTIVCQALDRPPQLLASVKQEGSEAFTTGDANLDQMLGGGIRTGMVWELVGEGASGKTQLALQLSLFVQLPISQEILERHPLLFGSACSLSKIQTQETKSVDKLVFVLSNVLPTLIDSSNDRSTPIKLLVIDSLAELLLEDDKTSTVRLSERSKSLSAVASLLHVLANRYRLAVVVINRVVDVWDQEPGADAGTPEDLIYADQARFFNRADSIAGESRKSAALGLVWANQVNARVMLTRTGRRRHLEEHEGRELKRRRVESSGGQVFETSAAFIRAHDILVRRMTVIFSSVAAPHSVDFVVTAKGIEASPLELAGSDAVPPSATPTSSGPVPPDRERPLMNGVSLLDVASAERELQIPSSDDATFEEGQEEEDEEEAYWKELDDLGNIGESVDLAALEQEAIPSTPGPRNQTT
ncbi:P-loop containing nucleoside triphosphate hydrolase protein [Artomyces pyxidatus]|uniref:P-loop containing nucleoside triphosphate hydrolase protein n=1 Tax=Artomyces pyxidatus TaxID=48021 RepID=A0ACB8SXG3_9AGAM|nr:P-loop containing nucleoside triphosphate hydrolase protein [Artomyces pyxidatus]